MNSPLGLVLVVVGADGMEGNASASCRAMLLGVTGGWILSVPCQKAARLIFFPLVITEEPTTACTIGAIGNFAQASKAFD